MARGAAEPDNHKKQITRFIVKAAAVLMLAAAPYLIFCGPPLAGLPDADEVSARRNNAHRRRPIKMRDECKRHRARAKSCGHLRRLPFASLTEEDPRYTIVFVTRGG